MKSKHATYYDKKYGVKKDHNLTCKVCSEKFIWNGRKKTKLYEDAKYCSRKCANSMGGNAKVKKYGYSGKRSYREIAFRHHGTKCVVCGFDKVIDVHHIDEDRDNNSYTNLIPLCPNHHMMIHRSNFSEEIKEQVNNYLRAVSDNGSTSRLHREGESSILSRSTKF